MQSPFASNAPLSSIPRLAGVAPLAPPRDDRDGAIGDEAAQARLALLHRNESHRTAAGGSANFGDVAWTAFTGEHTAETIRTYRVRAHDGLEWTYVQPYSRVGERQMPGEHRFVLHGALAGPIEVRPPSLKWRKPSFVVPMLSFCAVATALFGFGLIVLAITLITYPVRAKYTSPDPRLARWLRSQAAVTRAVRATRWGWLTPFGSRGWKLPWVVRLEPRGDGATYLSIKAPDVGRWDGRRWRVGFSQAEALARTIQGVLLPRS